MLSEDQLAPDRHRPLERGEYDQLVAAGAFSGERVELLEGVLVQLSPQGPFHASAVQRLAEVLTLRLVPRATIRVQLPFIAGSKSEPKPDIAIVPRGTYAESHPRQALLVIEVSETSSVKDRELKQEIYAHAGILEYWIADLKTREIEVFRSPSAGRYQQVKRVAPGESIELGAFPDVQLTPSEFLP